MPLQRQVISWPLTGSLDTKTAPLMVQPGSHIALDNVRQERTNEWRARNGTTFSSDDTLPISLPALRNIVLPGGSLWSMARPTDYQGAARSYSPTLGSGVSRWTGATQAQSNQLAPSCWSRAPIGVYAPRMTASGRPRRSCAVGGGYSLVAWSTVSLTGVDVVLTPDTGPDFTRFSGRFDSVNATAVATAFVASRLCVFWTNASGALRASIWNTTTGALQSSNILLIGTADVSDSYMDAIVYSGASTVTIVYRVTATNQIQFIEFNPVTLALSTSVTLAVDCSNSLSLLPDPDASGIRFVVAGTATPDVRVLRVNSAGAIQTNDQAIAARTSYATAGCAYQAGAGWMIVINDIGGTGLSVIKKRTAVISAATAVMASAPTNYRLDTNAWREPGTDIMRFIVGLHAPDGVIGTPSTPRDPQDTYYEMAFAYEDGNSTVTNYYPEPQARLLPLNGAAGNNYNAGLPQVTRVSADKFVMPLPRLNRGSVAANDVSGSVAGNTYAIDRWTVEYVNTSNVASLKQGAGIISNDAAYMIAGQLLQSANASQFVAHGASAVPFIPVLTPSVGGGLLTLLNTYLYVVTVDMRDERGNVWHGPPSIPTSVTLTGGQNTVGVVVTLPPTENASRNRTISVWRTKGNGSVYQLVRSTSGTALSFSFSDTFSDALLNSSDFLPVTLPTAITPAVQSVALFGNRLWAADRDYPSALWFTRALRAGSSPEFVNAFQISFLDEEGDITNIAQLDDKLIVFKASAIYFVQGDGPDDNGGGSFPVPVRVDSDIGSIVGSPVVSTGQEVYFVSTRGIYMIDRNLHVNFIGAPVDQYLNQPLVQTRETVIGAVFSPATNEVRFQTTNYRLVYDRLRGLWYRDTGAGMQNVVSTCMVGSKQALFKSDGTMWLEGDETVKQDNGVSYTPSIRSAWIRPSGTDGRLRLYMARIIMTRTSGGGTVTPTLRIYFDNDNSTFEFYTPAAIGGAQLLSKGSVQPRTHRCSAFSFEFLFAANDVSLRLEAWGAEVGMRAGAFRNNSGNAERWT